MKKIKLYIIAVIIIIFNLSGSILLQAQITDIDGNNYNAIVIGNQTWMRENLKVTRFRDGTAITNITANASWISATSPGYCWYNNNAANKDIYGALYNWFTINTGKLCPTGYHVPSNDEWTTLVTFLGGSAVAGGKLKEAGITHWLTPNTGATNISGFTALPGGSRIITPNPLDPDNGTFSSIGGSGLWWSSTLITPNAYYWGLIYNDIIIGNYTANQRFGMSVRCLRDMTPYLTSVPITSITQTSAQCGGDITGDGGMPVTARGVCWSTSANPTTFNNHTTDGSGIGSFISNLTGLTPNTTYYVRAYATNSVGTNYGTEYTFNTLSCPVITTTISGTTTICQNSAPPYITFTGENGTAPYTFTYKVNGGGNQTITTISGNSVSVAVPTGTAGSYTYNLVSIYDAIGPVCSQVQSGSATVTINSLPTATIGGTTAVCVGGVSPNITFLGASGTAPYTFTYRINTGTNQTISTTGGNSINLPVPTGTAGVFTYTLISVSDANACSQSQSGTAVVTVKPLPTANISYTGSPWCKTAGVQSVTLTGTTGGTFSASPAGLNIDPGTGAITPGSSTAQNYIVTYSISAGDCGIVTATAPVTITELPVATFSYSGTPYCSSAADPLPVFSGGGIAGIFSSDAGLVFLNTATGQIDLSASTSGVHIITNTIPAAGGCDIVTATNNITITEQPEIVFQYSAGPLCNTGPVIHPMLEAGTPSGGTFSATPEGLSINSETGDITLSTSIPGHYAVTYTIPAAGGCEVTSGTVNIIISGVPMPSIVYTGSPWCRTAGIQNVTLTGGSTGGSFTAEPAGLSLNATTGEINPSLSLPGNYSVTYNLVLIGCGLYTANTSVTIIPDNTITLTSVGSSTLQTVCIGTAITPITYATTGATGANITGLPAGVDGVWSEDVVTISGTPTASGPFNYSVTLTGGCGVITSTGTITVTPANTITLTSAGSTTSQTVCINTAITNITYATTGATGIGTGTGLPAGVTVAWAANVITISGTPTASGVFNYSIPLTGGCGIVNATGTITVNALPEPTITGAASACAGSTGNVYTTESGMTGYTWAVSAGGSVTAGAGTNTILVTWNISGSHTVNVNYINGNGCTASTPETYNVTVNTLPSAPTITTSGPTTFCAGGSVTLTSSAGTTYLWSNGATTPSINVTTAGSYTVQVTNASGCQSAASPATVVTVNALPTPILTSSDADNTICSGSSVTFTAGGGTNYNFRIGGITVQNSAMSTYTTSLLTNGQVVDVIVTNGTGCMATSSPITNTVNSIPSISVTTPAACSADLKTYSLEVTVSSGTVTSTSGTVTNSGSNVWTVTGVTAGTNITLKVTDSGGCENNIAVASPDCSCPLVQAPVTGGDKSYCESGMIPSINATVLPGETVDWYNSPSGGTLLNSGSLSYTPTNPGTYYALARNSTTGCVSNTRTSITVTMNPSPTATASNSGPITPGSPLSLTGGPGGMTNYAWTGPNGFSSSLQSPQVSASATSEMAGVYTLTVTNSSGCKSSDTTIVTINPYIVTNVNDNGIGSLRYAIDNANSTLNVKEVITFDIPGTGPFTLHPASPLPEITNPVVVDGYSQPGSSAKDLILLIEIDGTDAGTGSNGLTISGGGCIIKGLIINRFKGTGIQISGSASNSILGNFIGVDFSGTVPKGNLGDGIQINGSSNNQIGGTSPGEGNVISGNTGAGISILSTGIGNLISSNSIYSNGGIGIDLGGNGVTSNDTGDGDTGPNYLQNFPVLESVSFSTGSVTISGSLSSEASKVYNLQFFASKLADNSGNGEGQTYLGSKTVTTNASGVAVFTQAFSIKSSWGTVITATATDNIGNTSEFSKTIGGFQDQTVGQWPLIYTLNKDGVPNITDGTDLDAVRASFQTWSAIPTANIQFTEAGTTTTNKYANASDGVNLVSFEDDQFPFSYGVLAVAAKTLQIDPNTQVARIIDADIVVNPDFVNDIKYNLGVGYNNKNAGYFDIQSVITHEIGHVIGLLHSGVVGSTMFFTLNSGTKVQTLEQDDKSWASYGYPSATYNSTYGSISGNITYGYDGKPVAGALVYAIKTSTPMDSVHAYSDASGNYFIPGLIPGSYNVYIEPLDGNVNGYNLRPANISSYIYSNTVYTDYPGEFYNSPDLAIDLDDSKSAVTVNAGSTTSGINLITNKDNIRPTVVSVSPTDVSANLINISSNFSIKFSEAIDETSLTKGSCNLTAGNKTFGGSYTILGNNVVLFDPESVLDYSTAYTLHITTGLKDLRGNPLLILLNGQEQTEFTQSFTTIPQDSDPPKINEVIPANGATNVFVTDKIRVFFSEPVNKASAENGFTLSWTDSGGQKTAGGSFSWSNDNSSFTFTPSGSLKENTVYTIKLSNSITDLSGTQMLSNESRTFTTVAQAQVIIKYLGPGNGNTSVPVTTPVVVDFSEPINPSTVNSATFKLLIGNTTIPGTFEFLNENSRVVFRPGVNLDFNQIYTVSLTSGIQDVSLPTSSNLSTSTTTFTTAAKLTVPNILYLEPSSGVVGNVVTITGTGFDPDPVKNAITFNGINAPVTKASLTSLTTEVPIGALSGPVEVKVNGTVSDNTMYFYIIPESLAPCDDIIDNKSTGSSSSHDADVTEAVSVSGMLNTYAYITNPEQGTVSVLNLTANETISTIPVGNTPMKIDINPQGTKAYVTNFNSHTVSVINLVKGSTYNTVIATIPVGIEPYGVAVTPDGKRVYVANYYSGNLSVIDEDPNSGGFDHVVANVSTGSSSGNVVVTADAGMVLVTGDFGLKIVNSNPADKNYNSVIANVSSGTQTTDVTATADAGIAIVSTKDGHLLVVNLHPENGDYSDAVIANVSTGTQGSNVEASADNMFVYVTDTEHDQILVYQIGVGGSGTVNGSGASGITLIPHNKIPVPKAPIALAISADASRLYVIDTNAGTGQKEITTIAICCGPISPTKAIGDLIITIQTMINKGDIPKLRGYALIVTLNSALRNQYANRLKLELIDLNAFKALVNTYIKNKQISAVQGNALIKSINAIIAQLNGTKSGESEIYLSDRERTNQELISRSKLGVIYPNPFSQSVTINYEIAENKEALTKVQIMIYDISGRLVSTLVDNMMQSGCYTASWKGDFDKGGTAPYGTYLVKFRAGDIEEVSKIMLIKPR